MSNTIYVGNISYDMNEEQLREIFAEIGNIEDAKIIQNKFNGRSRGFGFVTFSAPEFVQKALELNGIEIQGRKIFVSIAREKTNTSE